MPPSVLTLPQPSKKNPVSPQNSSVSSLVKTFQYSALSYSAFVVTLYPLEPKVLFLIFQLLQNLVSLAHPTLLPTAPQTHHPTYYTSPDLTILIITSHSALPPVFYYFRLPFPKKTKAYSWHENIMFLLRYLQRKSSSFI